VTGWRREVDLWWAGALRLPAAAVRAGGVYAADHLDHVGVLAVVGAAGRLAYGPADSLAAVRACLAQVGHDHLGASCLAAALGHRAGRVLGPAWYGYATAVTLQPRDNPAVRALTEEDMPLLARLHDQTPPADRDESGTTGLPAFGYVRDGALLAIACLGSWREMPTIGVLTHPRARGQGLATAVVIAAAREGLDRRPVVQYRAWRVNTASITVATRAGFTHYCDSLVVDLAGRRPEASEPAAVTVSG
jgi:GNAT superfamily N-acetyltransferase